MKILKRMGWAVLFLVVAMAATITLFVNCSPQFGGTVTAAQMQTYAKTGHFKNGKFLNLEPFPFDVDCHSITEMLKKMFHPPGNLSPLVNIDVQKIDPKTLKEEKAQLVWLGHSSSLLRMDRKIILLDPTFSQYASPHPWLGRRRYSKELPFQVEDLPTVDVILISHDHYDHLDYESIVKLAPKTRRFIVPLGIGNHLRRWGVDAKKITELDWWKESKEGSIKFVLTPSQHMSGRGLTGQSSTLWGSWVIHGSKEKVFFSGDGGYGSHFKKIGKKYGPFDLALMECGQYDELWKAVHLTPEQTVQAGMEVQGKVLMPVHWGAFSLANHSWIEPVTRFTAAAKQKKQPFTTPEIGQVVTIQSTQHPNAPWWKKFMVAKKP